MRAENNNKEVIRRITRRSLKKNRAGNVFAILAVFLTTFMISTIFCIGITVGEDYKLLNQRIQGTMANVRWNAPTSEQIKSIKEDSRFDSAGICINAGEAMDKGITNQDGKIEVTYYDNTVYEEQILPCIGKVQGNYPKKESEVMISKNVLGLLHKETAKIGDKITLLVRMAGQKELRNYTFSICGIYKEYTGAADYGHLLVSEEFIKKNHLDKEKFTTAEIDLKSEYKDEAEAVMQEAVRFTDGQKVQYLFDVEADNQRVTWVTGGILAILILFIILSGYLLIYNVLNIMVKKNINFYGLLKTIGTSPKQIRGIVKGQVCALSGIGIPAGIVAGAFVANFLLPRVIATLDTGMIDLDMTSGMGRKLLVLAFAALLSFLAVLLSSRRPAKAAASISPTEALRYTGIYEGKKKNRKTSHGGKLYRLAWHNVFRDRKRAILVFLSLFMGITTFLMVQAFMGGLRLDNYIERYMPYDFELENTSHQDDKLDKKTVEEILALPGVKGADLCNEARVSFDMAEAFTSSLFQESMKAQNLSKEQMESYKDSFMTDKEANDFGVQGISDTLIEEYNKEAKKPVDVAAFREGKIALVHPESRGTSGKIDLTKIKGKAITITAKMSGHTVTYEAVLLDGKTDMLPYGVEMERFAPTVYISSEAMESLEPEAANIDLKLYADKEEESDIRANLERIVNKQALTLTSKSEKMEMFTNTSMTLNIIGIGIAVILILIGILNFINVMITGVFVRLRELAVMESIGMAKKQVMKMLMYEGLYYSGVTTCLVGTIGMALVTAVAKGCTMIADYAVFAMPVKEFLLLIVAVVIICMITPLAVYRIATKQTVTERLRSE